MPSIHIAILSDDQLLGGGRRAAFGPPLRSAGPQVLLVDSRMEGALALCAALRREGGAAVVFMAGQDDDAWAMSALEAGARGIPAKSGRAKDLVPAQAVESIEPAVLLLPTYSSSRIASSMTPGRFEATP